MVSSSFKRCRELIRVSLDQTWLPLFEKPKRLVIEWLAPLLTILFFTFVDLIIIKVIGKSKYKLNPNLKTSDPYEIRLPPLLPTASRPNEGSYCYNVDGSPRFKHCFGVINECPSVGIQQAFDALLGKTLYIQDNGTVVKFADYSDAERRVLRWVGRDEVPSSCGHDCMPASDFGFILACIYQPPRENETMGTEQTMVLTSDLSSLRQFTSNSATYNLAYIDELGFERSAPPGSTGAPAAQLYGLLMQELAAIPSDPSRTPPGKVYNLPRIREVITAVVSHRPTNSLNSLLASSDSVCRLAPPLFVPLFIICFYLIQDVTIGTGVNRIVLQTGQHHIPFLIGILSKALSHFVIYLGEFVAMGFMFRSVYRPLFFSGNYTVSFIVLFIVLSGFGYMIQCLAVAALVPNKAVSLVFSTLIMTFSPGIAGMLQLQSSRWPFILLTFFMPGSFMATVPDYISSLNKLIYSTHLISGDSSPAPPVSPGSLFSPDYPVRLVDERIWGSLAENVRSGIVMAPKIFITEIAALIFWCAVLYIGMAVRPIEEKGSFRWRMLFARIPGCDKLRERANKTLHQLDYDSQLSEGSSREIVCRTRNVAKYYPLAVNTNRDALDSLQQQGRLMRRNKRNYLCAVQGITTRFEQGHITALIGMNGAGKTTFLRMLLGVEQPSDGTVRLLGTDPYRSATTLIETLPLIGFVQQHNIVGDFSCRLHCELMCALRCVPGGRAAWRDEARRCLGAVGLINDQKYEASGMSLSGGQKRRLMIAMAMCGAPPLLVLDEPSAGLSADAKVELDLAIRAAAKHSSVIITEHDLDEIDGLADTLIIVRDGRIVAEGTSLTLKQRYGQGYSLRVTFRSDCPLGQITGYADRLLVAMRTISPAARIDCQSGRDVFFILGKESDLAALGECVEGHTDMPISSFSFDIATLSDVFLALASEGTQANPAGVTSDTISQDDEVAVDTECSELDDAPLDHDLTPENVVSGLKAKPHKHVSYITWLLSLIKTDWTIGWRSLSVMSMHISFILICSGLAVCLMLLFPVIEKLRKKMEAPYSLNNASGATLLLDAVMSVSHGVDFIICPEGEKVSPDPEVCHWDSPDQITEVRSLMNGLLPSVAPRTIEWQWIQREYLIREKYKDYMHVQRLSVPNFQDMKRVIIEWRGPDRVAVYAQPDFYVAQFINIGVATGPAQFIAALIDQTRQGYQMADMVIPNSLLFDLNINNMTNGSAVRTFSNDLMTTVFVPIMGLAPLQGMLFGFVISSVVLVIAHSLTQERVSGFGLQLRLLGERKCANVISWLLSLGIYNSVISFAFTIVFSTINLAMPKTSDVTFSEAFHYSFIFATGAFFASLSWDILGILMSYYFKNPAINFQAVPLMQCTQFVAYIAVVGWAMSNSSEMTLDEVLVSWNRIELILGLVPLSFPVAFGSRSLMTGCFSEMFPYSCDNVTVCTCVQFSLLIVLFTFLYFREQLEWGAIQPPKVIRALLCLGSQTHGDAPQPSKKNYATAHFDVEGQARPEAVRHPLEDATVQAERDAVQELPADTMMAFRDVRREFVGAGRPPPIIQAVRGLNLLIRKGDCVGLVGENGAGKSTALSMAIKQLTPTRGEMVVRAQHIGYVAQQNSYQSMLSVRQHIELFAILSGMELTDAISIAYTCGLKPHMSKRPDQLSGGYKRRLCLALALITSTELLIADEVAAGVDIHAQREIQALMDSLKTAGCSLVVTSHHMETVDRLVSRVAMMVKGRLRAIDTPDALKQKFTQGLSVTMQITQGYANDVLRWLAGVVNVDVKEITVLPALGGDCRFIVPSSCGMKELDLLRLLRPSELPPYVQSAAVAPTSLQSVFLCFEKEARELQLKNI